ncbi:MAG TPA: hypothetical protein VF331_16100 [Polyangiales bacterium]
MRYVVSAGIGLGMAIGLIAGLGCSADRPTGAAHRDGGPGSGLDGGQSLADGAVVGSGASGSKAGGSAGASGTGAGQSGAGGATGGAGTSGAGTVPTLSCHRLADTCKTGADCCSGLCDGKTLTCSSNLAQCSPAGAACVSSTECCNVSCVNKVCAATACISDNGACTSSASCCSGTCSSGGTCAALNTACRTAGNTCTSDTDCCSQLCSSGKCQLGASFCTQTGDTCLRNTDCCSSSCSLATGATLGTCAQPPSGASNCSGEVDGTVCNGCGTCCSRLCAPYAATGVNICQPASGCHVNGDLCRKTSDCCGAVGSGVPGDGNVTCDIATGAAVGICRNPMSCNPQGDVCHYKNYACNISSSRNDCCGGVGNSGVCQLDKLGVPRCNGLGTTCRKSGESCASAADCCSGLPCVPDSTGKLHCYTPPSGGPSCVGSSGACTINADCCSGSSCIAPIGSTQGTCSVPPGTGGTGGTSGAGGTTGGTGGTGGSPACSLYGQSCSTTTSCCSGVPCTSGSCVFPIK